MTDQQDNRAGTDSTVRVEKVYTHNGERLEIRGGEYTARLDALELESISWQDEATVTALVDDAEQADERPSGIDGSLGPDPVRIENEYGIVEVALGTSDSSERLRISAPKLGHSIELTPTELHMFSQQPQETFSEFLEEPFGPDAEDHDTDWH